MIFVDTWAWIALLDDTDQYHRAAKRSHRQLLKKRRKFVTSDFVLNELINYVYSVGPAAKAQATINAILSRADAGTHLLVHVSPHHFRRAWELRQRYDCVRALAKRPGATKTNVHGL